MAKVTIGGRELEVKPATLGFLRHKLVPWRKRLAESKSEEETIDLMVELILLYIGQNDGIDAAFVLEHVPADSRDTLAALRAAAGQKESAEGEAQSP